MAINCRRRRRLGQASVEPRVARDVQRLLTDLADAAADHVVDLCRVDASAIDQSLQREAEHFDRMPGGKDTTALAKGSPQTPDDDRLAVAVAGHRGGI